MIGYDKGLSEVQVEPIGSWAGTRNAGGLGSSIHAWRREVACTWSQVQIKVAQNMGARL